MIGYAERLGTWTTPRGNPVSLTYRDETSDWNTIASVMENDEYGLADLYLEGLALDIGAHLGSVAIALAADNPGLTVIAVEPIMENVGVMERNVLQNGLVDRVLIAHSAAGAPGEHRRVINYRGGASDTSRHHAFIGNSGLISWDEPHRTEDVGCLWLDEFTSPIAFMKIDCEGCEWDFLTGSSVALVERIHGEWHPMGGHSRGDVLALLADTHEVTFSGPVEGPGGFVAVRR